MRHPPLVAFRVTWIRVRVRVRVRVGVRLGYLGPNNKQHQAAKDCGTQVEENNGGRRLAQLGQQPVAHLGLGLGSG